MIKFENVSIKYINDFYALYNKNFEINSNTLFVGDAVNGSKAVMRILSKIDTHYEGNIFISNTNIKEIGEKNLPIAYVPEKFELFKFKSIYSNIAYPLKIRKIKNYKDIINEAFKDFKLEEFFSSFKHNIKTKVYKLNISEQKILTLIRAVIRKPKFLLVEDFFKNLDTSYYHIAISLIEKAKQFSTIIACEENKLNFETFRDFEIIIL